MGAVYLTGAVCTLLYSQLMVRVAQQIVQELRQDLFDRVQTLPLRFFDANTHGELMSRFTNDIDVVAEALNNSFTVLIQSFVVMLGTVAMLIALNAALSAIVLVSFIGMFLFLRFSGKRSHAGFSEQQKHMGRLNGFIEEMVEGQKVVKVFNHEDKDFEEFSLPQREPAGAAAKALTYSGFMVPVVVSLSYFNYAVCACVGAFFIAGWINLGSLASYLVYVRQTAMPVNQFSQQVNFYWPPCPARNGSSPLSTSRRRRTRGSSPSPGSVGRKTAP